VIDPPYATLVSDSVRPGGSRSCCARFVKSPRRNHSILFSGWSRRRRHTSPVRKPVFLSARWQSRRRTSKKSSQSWRRISKPSSARSTSPPLIWGKCVRRWISRCLPSASCRRSKFKSTRGCRPCRQRQGHLLVMASWGQHHPPLPRLLVLRHHQSLRINYCITPR
jgi:hypothetical protein